MARYSKDVSNDIHDVSMNKFAAYFKTGEVIYGSVKTSLIQNGRRQFRFSLPRVDSEGIGRCLAAHAEDPGHSELRWRPARVCCVEQRNC